MILDERLNPLASLGNFLSPDDRIRKKLTEDFESGSLTINDPGGGLFQSTWHIYNVGTNVFINRLLDDYPKLVFTTNEVPTELNLAFDSNMQPQVAYVEAGIVKFRWYDSLTENFTITSYPDTYSPRLCLDDKRELESVYRDVLLFYIKRGETEKLCYRQQRDRYTIEREITDVPTNTIRLGRVGMANTQRVQIEFITQEP